VFAHARQLADRAFARVTPGALRRGPGGVRRVALTFDDGPHDLTSTYLEALDDLGVPATFFVCGQRAEARPDAIREIRRRGHQLAGHGYDHTRFPELSRHELLAQCARTAATLGSLDGQPWVRPPHGALDLPSLATLRGAGYVVALWSLSARDWATRDREAIAAACAPSKVLPGEVILLHEGEPETLAALPRIVTALHASGFECVTMADLFAR
jgi:peptidoglycan/xylan/chitin deacetylase (PgdA/CDA1 family)